MVVKRPKKTAKASLKATPKKAPPQKAKPAKKPKPGTIPRVDGLPGKPTDISWHDRFIETLSTSRSIRTACVEAKVTRTSAYQHKEKFPEFAARWEEAEQMGLDHIEGGLLTRCTEGLKRKKFNSKGKPLIDPETGKQYVEVDFNETAVLKVLAAKRPGVWGDKSKLELSGHVTMTPEQIVVQGNKAQVALIKTLRAAAAAGKDKTDAPA